MQEQFEDLMPEAEALPAWVSLSHSKGEAPAAHQWSLLAHVCTSWQEPEV